jgi:hypothetical protein
MSVGFIFVFFRVRSPGTARPVERPGTDCIAGESGRTRMRQPPESRRILPPNFAPKRPPAGSRPRHPLRQSQAPGPVSPAAALGGGRVVASDSAGNPAGGALPGTRLAAKIGAGPLIYTVGQCRSAPGVAAMTPSMPAGGPRIGEKQHELHK